jgi:O-acetylhomoserine/O-acetylserine sulfhydrylase-like pyridoxal-dependent enzyme
MLKNRASRSAVSALMGRVPFTISLMRLMRLGGHVHVSGQLSGGDAQWFHEVFQQNFAGVNLVKQFGGHVSGS